MDDAVPVGSAIAALGTFAVIVVSPSSVSSWLTLWGLAIVKTRFFYLGFYSCTGKPRLITCQG